NKIAGVHSPDSIFHVMKKVADWQLDNIRHQGWRHPKRHWTNGALYAGLLAFGKLANDSSYYNFLKRVGNDENWQITKVNHRYMADFYCVGQMYCGLYNIYHNSDMIQDLKVLGDTLIERSHAESLEWKNNVHLREWAWCDALFMGPPPLAMLANVTGEVKYM